MKPNKLLEKENLVMLPLAAIGLIRGIGEVLVKPFVMETTERVVPAVKARIEYIRTGEPYDQELN